MVGDGALGRAEGRGQLAQGGGALAQQIHHPVPERMAECFELRGRAQEQGAIFVSHHLSVYEHRHF
ncbi:hypothetical protein Sru01_60230 [Sphaerisporangium rufum]|uniref:Uncharacterized protein n=1 Tax=Sphaerisporangium rufum TaxID=1381558 RepID=A0A919V1F2_9ACTN|nr:hypothetical protein Sru01_60230 [Sphaerisporangium rufum]